MVRITRYPLPGVVPLYPLGSLVRAGVLDENECESLQAVRRINPLLFDLLLKRAVRFEGQIFLDDVLVRGSILKKSGDPISTVIKQRPPRKHLIAWGASGKPVHHYLTRQGSCGFRSSQAN